MRRERRTIGRARAKGATVALWARPIADELYHREKESEKHMETMYGVFIHAESLTVFSQLYVCAVPLPGACAHATPT